MCRSSIAINKRRRATNQRIFFMTERLDVTPKTTEHNLIVRVGKSEASRGLSATTELLVWLAVAHLRTNFWICHRPKYVVLQ